VTDHLAAAARERSALFDASRVHDACGIAFVCDLAGRPSHELVEDGLGALEHLEHRGAAGAEPDTGDGAGILLQMPHRFLSEVAREAGVVLPGPGRYAAGLAFLPADDDAESKARAAVEEVLAERQLRALWWRPVPFVDGIAGPSARRVQPRIRQLFVTAEEPLGDDPMALERRCWLARRQAERLADVYFPSLSTRTLVYKGMLSAPQLRWFFPDLRDERLESGIVLVHSRFSTNTFPSWPLAHPYRMIAHNGEINTLAGNRSWMRAREALASSELFGDALEAAWPTITPGASDSASFDEVLELLVLAGRPIEHAVLMMVPEAWEHQDGMDPAVRAFYRFHASLMEPWDGPAAIAFTDGEVVGAVLDRNGLRPGRWWLTDAGRVILASEVGVLDIPPEHVVAKGRLQPGRVFLVDTAEGRIVGDEELKHRLAAEAPYGTWTERGLVPLASVPRRSVEPMPPGEAHRLRVCFGYSQEDLRVLLGPMAERGEEPVGSMGNDAPPAVLSAKPRLLYDYFSQRFAQVTNPALDAIREKLVTSLTSLIGPQGNLLEPGPESCRQLVLDRPVLSNAELASLLHAGDDPTQAELRAQTVTGLFEVAGGESALEEALVAAMDEAAAAVDAGAGIVVLSDRGVDERLAPVPSLLLTSAVHHHLVRTGRRARCGLVVESAEAREVHHIAALLGYGAQAVNPYLALETVAQMALEGSIAERDPEVAEGHLLSALAKGVVKVMSKLGISTVASYVGAETFEALGISKALVERYFPGTSSPVDGIGLDVLAAEVAARHADAFPKRLVSSSPLAGELPVGGLYQWRRDGEAHLFNPETVYRLQHATRSGRFDLFRRYSSLVDEQAEALCTLRGLLRLREGERPEVPLDQVEPASEIVKRFSTGAMSYGSISAEAHETLAIAMNRLGAKSNTGEGGEDPRRFERDANGDWRRSAIKQVASGRFGVTSHYLVEADDIQIKIAQGAKPGEGGQLPGHKVYPWIAEVRHSTPGVGLISPPPHHDIYSIEDIAELIFDLKMANPRARVHVKLVSELGVGTVAAGVAKAHADVVLISGYDGGTGAAPLTSIKHAGTPWELGLAETQQTLVANGLRDRIVVQVDGQLKTGRDVVVAALLGAEEFGFATAPLVVSGCVMMRVCHLDTCPVGIATQNPELRKRFSGKPEFVEHFFLFVAEEVRGYLAKLGFRTLEEAVGHVELLDAKRAAAHWKASGLDLSAVLAPPGAPPGPARRRSRAQQHRLEGTMDARLIELAAPSLSSGLQSVIDLPVANVNRAVGTMLGSEVTRRFGPEGLPDDTICLYLNGSAGQSLGAFLPKGISIVLAGDANDYVGKGLSGGRLVLFPPSAAPIRAEDHVIAGNVCLYGATGGEAFFRGRVGERFAVRNSGALGVAEGVGDHGCEYMTGGRVVVLGPTGRNFGAGMSGGLAFVWDDDGSFPGRVNPEMVDLEPPGTEELAWLEAVVRRHARLTGSELAEAILEAMGRGDQRFVAVVPRDFRRVLEAKARALEEGRPVDEVVMELAHG